MTQTNSQGPFRLFFEWFAHRVPDPETLMRSTQIAEDEGSDDEHSFVRRDEAFYWGWSRSAFL